MSDDANHLETRLRTVSREICDALRVMLRDALAKANPTHDSHTSDKGGTELRPSRLTSQLRVNKSLAGRVVRAIEETDEIRALRWIPTPQGLQLLQEAAEAVGGAGPPIQALETASSAYSKLLEGFPGGRTDLDAILVGFIPEERVRAERDARRTVFRGMTNVVGSRVGTNYSAYFVVPNPDLPHRLDAITIGVRQDLRHLRPSVAIPIFSQTSEAQIRKSQRARQRIDGTPVTELPGSILLPEFSSSPMPELTYSDSAPGQASVYFTEGTVEVNETRSVAFGWRLNDCLDRYVHESDFNCLRVHCPRPTEVVILDLFIHRDLDLVGEPFTAVDAARPKTAPTPSSMEREVAPNVIRLSDGPGGLETPYVRNCEAMAEHACSLAGISLDDFVKYRVTIEFPAPALELGVWWLLPDAPS